MTDKFGWIQWTATCLSVASLTFMGLTWWHIGHPMPPRCNPVIVRMRYPGHVMDLYVTAVVVDHKVVPCEDDQHLITQ